VSDYTAAVIRLETAYESMKLARKRVTDEIKAKHRIQARKEAEAAVLSLEVEFAHALAVEHAAGLPGNVIREEVFHTQDWSRWKKWRDLAEIEPERITVANARVSAKEKTEQSKKKYEWIDGVLHWYKWSNGEQMPFPMIVSDYATLSGNINWGPTLFDVIDNDNALWKEIKATIQKDARSGIIPDRDLFRWQPGNEHLAEKQEELNAAWIGWTPEETK
jgi:hypothetical protein